MEGLARGTFLLELQVRGRGAHKRASKLQRQVEAKAHSAKGQVAAVPDKLQKLCPKRERRPVSLQHRAHNPRLAAHGHHLTVLPPDSKDPDLDLFSKNWGGVTRLFAEVSGLSE